MDNDNSDCGEKKTNFQVSQSVQSSQNESSISTNKRKMENDQEIGNGIQFK
jgi:hypothetical protein